MDNMKVGDELDFKGPTGKIVYDGNGVFDIKGEKRKYKKIGCISGGTGVTIAVYLTQGGSAASRLNFERCRSRLYRRQNLRKKPQLKSLADFYTIHTLP